VEACCGELGSKGCRCLVGQGRVWPCGVVVFNPFSNDFLGLVEAEEQGLVQKLVAPALTATPLLLPQWLAVAMSAIGCPSRVRDLPIMRWQQSPGRHYRRLVPRSGMKQHAVSRAKFRKTLVSHPWHGHFLTSVNGSLNHKRPKQYCAKIFRLHKQIRHPMTIPTCVGMRRPPDFTSQGPPLRRQRAIHIRHG